jgi:putative PIN family toxin of toxin-antitoxin system
MAGSPRQVLDLARTGMIGLFTSAVLLAELEDVLGREKFAQRFALAGLMPHDLVLGYAALATLVEPVIIPSVVLDDPDDDVVLVCAVAAHAEVIVSGDSHLLRLKDYQSIHILSAADLLARILPP